MTDRQTDGRSEFSSLYRVCIACSAIKTESTWGRVTRRPTVALFRRYFLGPCGSDLNGRRICIDVFSYRRKVGHIGIELYVTLMTFFSLKLPCTLTDCVTLPNNLAIGSVFTALHVMQTRYCDENSVCLSVCPFVCLSVCHTRVL